MGGQIVCEEYERKMGREENLAGEGTAAPGCLRVSVLRHLTAFLLCIETAFQLQEGYTDPLAVVDPRNETTVYFGPGLLFCCALPPLLGTADAMNAFHSPFF